MIYNRGKNWFTFFRLFTLTATPATPREKRGFRVVYVGLKGRVRVGNSIRGVIYNRGNDLIRFFCLFTMPATLATPLETPIIGARQKFWSQEVI